MKKKQVQILRYTATFLVSLAVGVGGSYVWNQAVQPVSAPVDMPEVQQTQTDSVQVRVRGGVAEWFDGMRWNPAGSMEQLEQSDPTAAQSETWRLVAQQRAAAKQQQRQSALTQLSREENALATGEKPVQQTPSRRPAASTTTPAAAAPATTPDPTPTPTPTPDPTPTPEPVQSGDGTDMDGGGDFWG